MLSYFPIGYKFGIHLSDGVGAIVVSIAAFQAVDPGSIPGRRNIFLFYLAVVNMTTSGSSIPIFYPIARTGSSNAQFFFRAPDSRFSLSETKLCSKRPLHDLCSYLE